MGWEDQKEEFPGVSLMFTECPPVELANLVVRMTGRPAKNLIAKNIIKTGLKGGRLVAFGSILNDGLNLRKEMKFMLELIIIPKVLSL